MDVCFIPFLKIQNTVKAPMGTIYNCMAIESKWHLKKGLMGVDIFEAIHILKGSKKIPLLNGKGILGVLT